MDNDDGVRVASLLAPMNGKTVSLLQTSPFDDCQAVGQSSPRSKQHRGAGLLCLAVVASWVSQSEVSQALQVGGYNKPMAITWFNHSIGASVIVLLLPVTGLARIKRCLVVLMEGKTRLQLLRQLLVLSSAYLLADWVWYIGLPHTSVAVGTIIFNTSIVWVYGISILLGREPCRWQRVGALLVSLLGVAVVTFAPTLQPMSTDAVDGRHAPTSLEASNASASAFGSGLVLAAAIGYALYEVLLDDAFGRACQADALAASAFTSMCGLLTVAILWPAILLVALPAQSEGPLASFGLWETPEFPPPLAFYGLCLNAVLATMFNVSLTLAVTLCSPLLASVSCMLTIPTSLLVDTVWHGYHFGVCDIAGSALVVVGFGMLARDEARG